MMIEFSDVGERVSFLFDSEAPIDGAHVVAHGARRAHGLAGARDDCVDGVGDGRGRRDRDVVPEQLELERARYRTISSSRSWVRQVMTSS